MNKIMITGATGFIGKACTQLFQKKGWEVHSISLHSAINQNSYNHLCNILDAKAVSKIMKKIQPNYLIHLAWYVEHGLFWTDEKNIDFISASVHLYKEFSKNGGQKAIFIGSCAEYDYQQTLCVENTTLLIPNTLYGLAKKQTFELLTELRKNYSPFNWVRIFNIYGPHENKNRLIPYIFNSYLENKTPILNNPSYIRDHLYVENLAEILLKLIQIETEGAINIGQGKEISIADLACLIHARYFTELPQPILNENKQNVLLPSLAKLNNLNLQPTLTFEEGLDKTYQWWKSQYVNNLCSEIS